MVLWLGVDALAAVVWIQCQSGKWDPSSFAVRQREKQKEQNRKMNQTEIQMLKIQFRSVVQSCPTLWPHGPQHARLLCPSPTPRACPNSCPLVGDAIIQLFHPWSSPSPPAFNLSQHQGLFKWVSSAHQVAKVLEFRLQHQSSNEYSGLISFRMDWLDQLLKATMNDMQQNEKCCLEHQQQQKTL